MNLHKEFSQPETTAPSEQVLRTIATAKRALRIHERYSIERSRYSQLRNFLTNLLFDKRQDAEYQQLPTLVC